jgi:hypothetical protein
VVEVRDGESWGRCAPVPYYLCQVLQGKQGNPPSSGLRLAQIILSPSALDVLHRLLAANILNQTSKKR